MADETATRHKDFSGDFSIAYDEAASAAAVSFRCFDTPNSITLFNVQAPDFEAEGLLMAARKMCLQLHVLWSFSLKGTDVARLNSGETRVAVAPETAALIQAMKAFNRVEPTFDFTVGAVSLLWKSASSLPAATELEKALGHVGAEKVMVEGTTVVKADPLVRVDVGGAAKGYAADLVAGMLRDAGVTCANIDLGGNLYMMGEHPEGRPWRVAVRIPAGMEIDPVIVDVRDKSVVTSGTYERFTQISGTRYAHIIDARTGWPVESDIVSATVMADSSLQADMLATTALALGSRGIGPLMMRHPDCAFVAITDAGAVIRSL